MEHPTATRRMPAVFVGHGSPMLALEDSAETREIARIGQKVLTDYGRPKAILMVSAHWYEPANLVQHEAHPRQVFDMYGFPRALYEVKYEPEGSADLSKAIEGLRELGVRIDNSWGIDHGAWTVLVHMFPDADIPVVQLSVNSAAGAQGCYDIGSRLARLRDAGYLVIGSGNVVHNLRRVEWDNPHGTAETEAFNSFIIEAVGKRDDTAVIRYGDHPLHRYAVPTPDHFLPLLYVLGATQGERSTVFNNTCNLGSMAMTGFFFGD